jgi:hypothetical protein
MEPTPVNTTAGNATETFMRGDRDAVPRPAATVRTALPMAASSTFTSAPVRRSAPGLPFGWGAVTVLLVGAAFLVGGILLILVGFLGFLTGTIGAATSSSFSVTAFFESFIGAIMLFVIGGVLAGIGGWLIRLWWIFLLVGVVTGVGSANTARERESVRASEIRVRCHNCGRLNPEFVRFCMDCRQPV